EEVAGLAPQLAMCELSEVRPRCGASRARPRGQRAEPEQGPAPPVPDRGIAIVRMATRWGGEIPGAPENAPQPIVLHRTQKTQRTKTGQSRDFAEPSDGLEPSTPS